MPFPDLPVVCAEEGFRPTPGESARPCCRMLIACCLARLGRMGGAGQGLRWVGRVSLTCPFFFGLSACKAEQEVCFYQPDLVCPKECDTLQCAATSGFPEYSGQLDDEAILVVLSGCGAEEEWTLIAGNDLKTARAIATFPDDPAGPWIHASAVHDGAFYLTSRDRVFVYDGTGDAREVEFDEERVTMGDFFASGETLYMRDSLHLYRVDGDRAVRILSNVMVGGQAAVGGGVCFVSLPELWCDVSGTFERVATFYTIDSRPLALGRNPLVAHDGAVYFRVFQESGAAELFRYDGTGEPEIVLGLSATATTPELYPLASLDGQLLLIAEEGSSLWSFDGQALTPYPSGDSFHDPLNIWPDPKQPGAVLLLARAGSEGNQVGDETLYWIDGTGPPKDVPTGVVDEVYHRDGEIFIEAGSPRGIFRWLGGGEVEPQSLSAAGDNAFPTDPFLHDGVVYVRGSSKESGQELFRLTQGSPELVRDFYPGSHCFCDCPEPD